MINELLIDEQTIDESCTLGQLPRRQSPTKRKRPTTNDCSLRKFIHHPVVLSSFDQDYFRKFACDMGGSSRRDQHDLETVAALMPMTARDLKGPVLAAGEKLFQFVGALRMAETIAEQNHAVFDVSGLPCVEEMVSGCQCKHVTRV